MRPRDTVRPSGPRLPARVSLAAGVGASLAALGGLIAATNDGPGQIAGLGVVCLGVASAMVTARASGSTASAGIETLESALASELDRARRHRRSLALIRIADSRPASSPGTVRAADRLWADQHGLIALLPETNLDGAERAAGRLLDQAGNRHEIAIAVFPEDGLTGGALLARLETARHPAALAARRRDVGDDASAEDDGETTAIS